jgi:hypothetical protein
MFSATEIITYPWPVVLSGYSGFFHHQNWLLWYSWNIALKHKKSNIGHTCCNKVTSPWEEKHSWYQWEYQLLKYLSTKHNKYVVNQKLLVIGLYELLGNPTT